MAIINATPDSFSGNGIAAAADPAVMAQTLARRAEAEGAHMIDVGGVSTRPGSTPVDPAEEYRRVLPAVAAIREATSLPVSIDSYNHAVVAPALDAGATMVNSVWGVRTPSGGWNERLIELVAERGVPIVLMHNRRARAVTGPIGAHYKDVEYRDLVQDVLDGLSASADAAIERGIQQSNIIVDPGIGFGKTPLQNIVLIRELARFRQLGFPVLISASRKSFIGHILGCDPVERDAGTASITAIAAMSGVDIVRVHNVRMNVDAARVADAISRYRPSRSPLPGSCLNPGSAGRRCWASNT